MSRITARDHNFKTVDTDDIKQVAKFVFKNAGLSTGFIEKYKRIFQLAKAGDKVANELIATRCDRGANIARDMGLDESVAQGIFSLDEHYNGKGHSEGLQGEEIPIESRVALLSQCADVFNEIGGKALAVEQVKKRSGTWFDPEVVHAFLSVSDDDKVWQELDSDDIEESVSNLFPENQTTPLSENDLNQVVQVYGTIVDAKSPFTSGHSKRVAKYAVSLGESFGLKGKDLEFLHHAAALHDIGKLGISNTILDKPAKLNQQEWELMKKHPAYSHDILSKLDAFNDIAKHCAAHHEKLDGTGYYLGMQNKDISLITRIITVVDIFDALTADRPYRKAMTIDQAFNHLNDIKGYQIDGDCVNVLFENQPHIIEDDIDY